MRLPVRQLAIKRLKQDAHTIYQSRRCDYLLNLTRIVKHFCFYLHIYFLSASCHQNSQNSMVLHILVLDDCWEYKKWFLTAIYANPHYQARSFLWDKFTYLALDMDSPWAILGDFNSILNPHERNKGLTQSCTRSMNIFHNTIDNCCLIDAGFQGLSYTQSRGDLSQRLDKLLINIHQRLMFKDVFVFHLPQFKLDRTPILVKLFRDGPPNRHHKPFCFLSPWVMHEDFTRFMKENLRRKSLWNPYLKLLSKSSKSGTNWFLVIFLLKRSNF